MTDIATIDWSLYVIVDPMALPAGRDVVDVTRAAIKGGAGVIQYRDKRSSTRVALTMAKQVRQICAEHDVPFIMNDRLDLALAVAADGVHLGPEDLPVALARRIAPDLLIGASAGTPREARALVAAGADYLGSGAVFDASASKPDAFHNRGIDALSAVVDAVDVPVVGIGGITAENAGQVARTGANGVAVIRAVCCADDVERAAADLRSAFSPG